MSLRLASIFLVAVAAIAAADRGVRRYEHAGAVDRDGRGHHHFKGRGPSNSYGAPAPHGGHGPSAFGPAPAPSNSYGAPAGSSIPHGFHGAPSHSYGAPAVAHHHSVHKKGAALSKFRKFNKKGHIGSGHYADTSNYGGGYGGSSSSSSGGNYFPEGGKKGHGKHHKYVYVGTYYDRPELKPHIAKFKVEKGVKKWWKELATFAKKLYKYRTPYDYTYGKQYTIPKVKKIPVIKEKPVISSYGPSSGSYGFPEDSYGPPSGSSGPSNSYGPPGHPH